jgi:hypothetical protein
MLSYMEPDAPPSSPPAGWALTRELPPGYVEEKSRPGKKLGIAFLVLMAIGFILNIFGYWVRFQSTSTPVASNPASQFHAGQVFSAIGFAFIMAGIGFGVVSIVMRIRSLRSATEGSAHGQDSVPSD